MHNHANIVDNLRRSVARIDDTRRRLAVQSSERRLPVGIDEIDSLLDGGLTQGDLHEFRCSYSRDIGCTVGLLLGLVSKLKSNKPIIWIGEPSAGIDSGMLFPDGLEHFGFDASRFVHISPMHLNDCLWAAGEATRVSGLAAVVLHFKGNPQSFDLSVSRKLMLRARTSETPVFVLRQAGEEEASSATTRWHIKPAPSHPDQFHPKGVGHMRLTLTLEKNRNGQTGQWLIAWNPQTRSFEHAAEHTRSAHTLLPIHSSAYRQDLPTETGQVVAFG